MDILPLLDELRTIARNGLTYTADAYDTERYQHLLHLADAYYGQPIDLPPTGARQRLAATLGQITPKVGADAALFDEQGRILLVLRADDERWCLPCGWVDPNESPAEAAVRETREETGIEAELLQLVDVFTRKPGAGYGAYSMIAVVYLCRATGGTLRVSHESLDVRYWAIDEAPTWHAQHRGYALVAHAAWLARRSGAAYENGPYAAR